ncbi:uncharacterized protein BCR38DRAFT_441157 [Pseudomassariella vexata]|uniref:Cell wall mannoprotein PIR1-like C-terminal domain-containing protein n=1 Tax=Pseudomassariella vexata TaxID=1141098 RepID=A0A1Y2DT09_9PEZI|nr:uncharacterized protein BCR38DRAFT_441157 [Pseudomassariella vexata]ORY61795.1 hypothetical protein BCR38DRAFT_441157 [Pseudomassariella vexata]
MRHTFALACTLLGAVLAAPQGVTDPISPDGETPSGCSTSFDGNFEITVATITEKRSISQPEVRPIPLSRLVASPLSLSGLLTLEQKRGVCGANGILVMSLTDGIAKDSLDRTGYIASNYQFQFDKPAQAGALYTSGFSICENNVLALGANKTFYRCLSGNFYNLYDRNWAAQCEEVSIIAMSCGSEDTASQAGDGQVVGTTVVQTTIITALSDGQPQVVTTSVPIPLCQIGDGQVQVHTTPCASVTSVASTTPVPVSQFSDGQIQVTPPGTAPATAPPATTTAEVTLPTESVPVSVPATDSPSAVISASTSASASESASVSESVSETASPTTPEGTSPAETSPAATTSAPPQSGSSRFAASSVGALVFGMMAAFICS